MESPLTTKAVILQALLPGPTYGSEIMKRIKRMTREKLILQSGSVYPALKSLQEDGFIVARDEPESGRACFYELTEEGKVEARRQRDMARIVFFPTVVKSKKKAKNRKGAKWPSRKGAKKAKKRQSSSSILMAS